MTTKVSLIADNAVTGIGISNLTITADDIANSTITTNKIDFGTALVPLGGIIMWSGVTAPSGYQLCNNSELPSNSPLRPTITNTPDLRERFIVGAMGDNPDVTGNGYDIGVTGGDNSVTLGTNNVPAHSHGVSNFSNPGNHYHGTGPNGSGFISTQWGFDVRGNGSTARFDVNDGPPFDNIVGDMGAGSHTHSFTIDNAFGNAQGGTDAHENRPPYYALAFIMRVL